MSIFFQMRRRFICVLTQWNWSIVKCWFTSIAKTYLCEKNIKLLAIFIATSWKYTYKSYFYRNRIIVIQIRIKHTGTKIRVASNVHKYLITPHTGLAIWFGFVVFLLVGDQLQACRQQVFVSSNSFTFHIDSVDE